MSRTAVYRYYDAEDRLLYIGMSEDPALRMKQHAADKPWWAAVADAALEWHSTREAAAEAEVLAIKAEDPLHNRLHSPSYVRPVDPGTPLTILRNGFDGFMDRVLGGEHLVLTKNGKAAAVLVPVEFFERVEAARAELAALAARESADS